MKILTWSLPLKFLLEIYEICQNREHNNLTLLLGCVRMTALEWPSGAPGAELGWPLCVGSSPASLIQRQRLRILVDRRKHLGVVCRRHEKDPGRSDPDVVRRETVLRLRDTAMQEATVRTLHHGRYHVTYYRLNRMILLLAYLYYWVRYVLSPRDLAWNRRDQQFKDRSM